MRDIGLTTNDSYLSVNWKQSITYLYSFVHSQNTIVFFFWDSCMPLWFSAQYVLFLFDYWKLHQQNFILYCFIAGNFAASWKSVSTIGNLKLLKIQIICLVCMNNVELTLRRQVQSHFSFRMQNYTCKWSRNFDKLIFCSKKALVGCM